MKKFCFILLSLCLLSGCTGSSFHPYKNTDGLYFQAYYFMSGKRRWKFIDDLRKAYI